MGQGGSASHHGCKTAYSGIDLEFMNSSMYQVVGLENDALTQDVLPIKKTGRLCTRPSFIKLSEQNK